MLVLGRVPHTRHMQTAYSAPCGYLPGCRRNPETQQPQQGSRKQLLGKTGWGCELGEEESTPCPLLAARNCQVVEQQE